MLSGNDRDRGGSCLHGIDRVDHMTAVATISAVFPCYNDETTIGGLVDDVHAALTPLVDEVEVIVVNDGSADGSREVLDKLAMDRPWLRVIHHEANGGYGKALLSGFEAAQHEWISHRGDASMTPARQRSLFRWPPRTSMSCRVTRSAGVTRGIAR